MRERARRRRPGVAGDEDAQAAARLPVACSRLQHAAVDERVAGLRGVARTPPCCARRRPDRWRRSGTSARPPARPARRFMTLRGLPQRELAAADAAGDEVAAAGAAGGRDQAQRRDDVARRALARRRPDPRRARRARRRRRARAARPARARRPRRRTPPRRPGCRRARAAALPARRSLSAARAVAAHVAHGEAVAVRATGTSTARTKPDSASAAGPSHDHGGRAAAGARRRGQRRRDEQAGEQASHAGTVRARAAPVKAANV